MKNLIYNYDEVKEMEKDLTMSVSEINREYKIKVRGLGYNMLVGVAGFLALVGDVELANRMLERANNSLGDVCVCKLRRGLQFSFYIH